jgi:hypothetical protein
MELYPWSFDSIHSHCHKDGIIFHSILNSFQAVAPLTGPEKGYFLGGSIFPSKMGPFAPFLATIQPLSSACAFLSGENEQKLLCMGPTFTANKSLPLYLGPKQLNFQLGIKPGK